MTAHKNLLKSSPQVRDVLRVCYKCHPSLQSLFQVEYVVAVYIGGSVARKGLQEASDFDIFFIISPKVSLAEFQRDIRIHFMAPHYRVGPREYVYGFGDYFKILYKGGHLDLFSNYENCLNYNKMMEGNFVIFDKSGNFSKILKNGDDKIYLKDRKNDLLVDLIYFHNFLKGKMKSGKFAASIRSYHRLTFCLSEAYMLFQDDRAAVYIGINEDKIIDTLAEKFGIKFASISEHSMQKALTETRKYIECHHSEFLGYLND